MKSGSSGLLVDPARADLAHQVHAHAVPAEREERAVPEAEDPGIAPDQIEAQRQDRVAQILAEQRHEVVGHARAAEFGGDHEVEQRHDHHASTSPQPSEARPEARAPGAARVDA